MARPKKAEPDKLGGWLPAIRCSHADLAMLKGKADKAGLSRGEFLRRLIRGAKIVVRRGGADAALTWEVNRLGNNLWQVLRELRHQGLPEPAVLERVLLKLERLLDRLLEDVADGSARR